ncbi:hypothetical protein B0T20DRAFT_462281 [Sordaria brevicollis]|uniref:TauD/TfdA-like domain-containing protein n=1 Tax=Sordaria brevicollis TaxID=83679 RepID=A0AAE0UAY9_SORBR|nr:hypothetical protein B0T20DRAFT_462281 [Sordaria brevicollis]
MSPTATSPAATTTPKNGAKDGRQPKTITIKELHPTFGAEILGVQWNEDDGSVSEEQLQELRDAVHKYAFLLLRSTPLTDSTHVSFSRLFASSPLDDISRFLSQSPTDPFRAAGKHLRYYPHLELFDASNLTDDGTAILDPDKSERAMLMRANKLFHSDLAYNPRRSSYSLLRAVELPPLEVRAEIGGDTEFADSRTAWDDLDEDMKKRLTEKDYTGVYNAAWSRKQGAPEWFRGLDVGKGPVARHKILQKHKESGRMNLCVGAYLWRLEDKEGRVVEESEEMIRLLNEHVARDKYVASVRWENPGDLVIWDNRAVLHRAGEFEGVGKYRRDIRRTTAFDTGPMAWGLNGVGAKLPTLGSITKEKGLGSTEPGIGASYPK